MNLQMHAAVVEAFGNPLVLRYCDRLSTGPGQILVKTEACGVFHTCMPPTAIGRSDPSRPSFPDTKALAPLSKSGQG